MTPDELSHRNHPRGQPLASMETSGIVDVPEIVQKTSDQSRFRRPAAAAIATKPPPPKKKKDRRKKCFIQQIEKPELGRNADSLCGYALLENSLRTDARQTLELESVVRKPVKYVNATALDWRSSDWLTRQRNSAATSAVVDGRLAP